MDEKYLSEQILKADFHKGIIELMHQRVLLFEADAMGTLRKDIIRSLGLTPARNILTCFGYSHGWANAANALKLFPNFTNYPLLGQKIHQAQGAAIVTITDFQETPQWRLFSKWEQSNEGLQHKTHFGAADECVCWTTVAWASGFTSRLLGKEMYCIEDKCIGKGDEFCTMSLRSKEDWGDEIESHLPYYKMETIDNLLKNVNVKLRQKERRIWQIDKLFENAVDSSGIIAANNESKKILDTAKRVAKSDFSVIITGESGTGKELLASYIHNQSSRALGPFVAFNCNAMPENLIESELFGYAKGAFTGANKDKEGLFEAANGGTLFLDEIGDASAALQGKLLRVLQEKEIRRVGDTLSRAVNVRVITATNVNLAESVNQGTFRRDLYYRLNMIELHILPLNERKEDILPLAHLFLAKTPDKNKNFSRQAMESLLQHDWKGNIRELKNVVERAAFLARGTEINPEDFYFEINHKAAKPDENIQSIVDVEKNLIIQALEKTKGNKKQAAALLGIGLATLYRKLKNM